MTRFPSSLRGWWPYLTGALLLTVILGAMVVDRVQHLRHGREIVVAIRPVDPRDLFKGDYVRLDFDITPPTLPYRDGFAPHDRADVYVTLAPRDGEGQWRVNALSPALPNVTPQQVVLKAKLTGSRLRYGIERYYVPEGTGPKLENDARTGKLAAILAIDARGRAAIKGLKLDGRVIHREPPL